MFCRPTWQCMLVKADITTTTRAFRERKRKKKKKEGAKWSQKVEMIKENFLAAGRAHEAIF